MFRYFRLNSSANKPRGPRATKIFAGLVGAALAFSAAIISIGCDSSSTFLPPPPDGLRGAAADESSSTTSAPVPPGLESTFVGARSVEMILDHRDSTEVDAVKAAARTQAGIDKVKLRTTILRDQDLPAHQVDLVREALARNPLALIVEPADPTDSHMAEVIQRARENGTPVVLLNRPLVAKASRAADSSATEKIAKDSAASPPAANPGAISVAAFTGAKPLVLVAPPSFTDSARQLVASAIRNAKNAKLDPKGGAVLLINTVGDSFIHERTLAIRSALKDSGITAVDEITFSKSTDVGKKLLKEKLKSNPKVVMVFPVDGESTAASRQVMSELIPDRLFVQSAYAAEGNYSDMTRVGDFAAVAGFIPNRVIRKAINAAVSLSQGHNVPSRVEVTVDVHDSAENSTTPQSPAYYKEKEASRKGS